jgi:chromosomal replication initiation ATPase DnaA
MRETIVIKGKKASFPQIGAWLGGFHHTTVMHGCARAAERELAA